VSIALTDPSINVILAITGNNGSGAVLIVFNAASFAFTFPSKLINFYFSKPASIYNDYILDVNDEVATF